MTVNEALTALIPGLREIYGDRLKYVFLYGSEARGTQTEESDVDIAVVLRDASDRELHERMLDLVVGLELRCGRVLSVVRIDYDKFRQWENVMPYYKNIRKDGVELWQAA